MTQPNFLPVYPIRWTGNIYAFGHDWVRSQSHFIHNHRRSLLKKKQEIIDTRSLVLTWNRAYYRHGRAWLWYLAKREKKGSCFDQNGTKSRFSVLFKGNRYSFACNISLEYARCWNVISIHIDAFWKVTYSKWLWYHTSSMETKTLTWKTFPQKKKLKSYHTGTNFGDILQ